LSLTLSVTRLVWFDSCSRLQSAFRPKTSSCGRHSALRHSAWSAFGPKRWSAFRPVGIQAASRGLEASVLINAGGVYWKLYGICIQTSPMLSTFKVVVEINKIVHTLKKRSLNFRHFLFMFTAELPTNFGL